MCNMKALGLFLQEVSSLSVAVNDIQSQCETSVFLLILLLEIC